MSPEAHPPSNSDPRSSSQQSLHQESGDKKRRRLLLIYIHGFMGDETSFRSFPAHVHQLSTVLLSQSHEIHTKIYPRYLSKRNIKFTTDNLSTWLEPHEDDSTDVIFLGHSMGGLIGAEVAMLKSSVPNGRVFKHRTLGTVNLDTPFLGIHHGVIQSGLASIFQPPDESNQDHWVTLESTVGGGATTPSSPERRDPLLSPAETDPNFNPSFSNDVILPTRTAWKKALHFIEKHSDNLTTAAKKATRAHLEFGGAMAHYAELKDRYVRIRVLDEENLKVRKSLHNNGSDDPPRIRFVNYYTVSSGRPKKSAPSRSAPSTSSQQSEALSSQSTTTAFETEGSIENLTGHSETVGAQETAKVDDAISEATKEPDIEQTGEGLSPDVEKLTMEGSAPKLGQVVDESRPSPNEELSKHKQAPAKDRKFCRLPPKDSHGRRDPCWVPLFMPGVDEVGAHCGLFFASGGYEQLIGDVAERIERWVSEDLSRAALAKVAAEHATSAEVA